MIQSVNVNVASKIEYPTELIELPMDHAFIATINDIASSMTSDGAQAERRTTASRESSMPRVENVELNEEILTLQRMVIPSKACLCQEVLNVRGLMASFRGCCSECNTRIFHPVGDLASSSRISHDLVLSLCSLPWCRRSRRENQLPPYPAVCVFQSQSTCTPNSIDREKGMKTAIGSMHLVVRACLSYQSSWYCLSLFVLVISTMMAGNPETQHNQSLLRLSQQRGTQSNEHAIGSSLLVCVQIDPIEVHTKFTRRPAPQHLAPPIHLTLTRSTERQ